MVELGTRAGYSAYYIARALKENIHGTLDCYDLWENNIENMGSKISKKLAEGNLREFKKIITLNLKDATGLEKEYETVDILTELVTEPYDYISFSYTNNDLNQLVFKSGGTTGTVVATLTLGYTGSNLTSITKT